MPNNLIAIWNKSVFLLGSKIKTQGETLGLNACNYYLQELLKSDFPHPKSYILQFSSLSFIHFVGNWFYFVAHIA